MYLDSYFTNENINFTQLPSYHVMMTIKSMMMNIWHDEPAFDRNIFLATLVALHLTPVSE